MADEKKFGLKDVSKDPKNVRGAVDA